MFLPQCLPLLIGSLPLFLHEEAVKVIFRYTPEIPLWPQLPKLPREGMVRQFLTGFPGLQEKGTRFFIDTSNENFAGELVSFYEEYMKIEEDISFLRHSRFSLTEDSAAGFFAFSRYLTEYPGTFATLKGQVTGPITTGIGLKDQDNKSIFYDETLRDVLIKLVTLKGRWQVEYLKPYTPQVPPLIFIDEPGMVSFGSSSFLGISREMAAEAIAEIITGIQAGGGLAGVHICANGDWGPVLSSSTDIISFDAFSYFDNIILFKKELIAFLSRGGWLAWGIVPTGDPQIVEEMTSEYLFSLWQEQVEHLSALGFTRNQLMQQTFITPSCGTGSLSPELALKVLALTADVSRHARELLEKSY